MNDPAQNSYVDSYVPPVVGAPSDMSAQPTTQNVVQPDPLANPQPVVDTASFDAAPVYTSPVDTPPDEQPTYAPTIAPPYVAPTPAPAPAAPAVSAAPTQTSSEALEDQNIFVLLGIQAAEEADKEKFLDELQQVIWEDFLERDVELLVTFEEKAELKAIEARTDLSAEQRQEEMVVYLEKLIPDLEEIMLEKALELKEAMFKERLSGLSQFHANTPDSLAKVRQAEALVKQGKWFSAAEILNSMLA